MERGVGLVGWWEAEAPSSEIGEGEPLEVEGEWEWVGGDLVGLWFASSFGIGRGVGGWRLVGHLYRRRGSPSGRWRGSGGRV